MSWMVVKGHLVLVKGWVEPCKIWIVLPAMMRMAGGGSILRERVEARLTRMRARDNNYMSLWAVRWMPHEVASHEI